MLRFLRNERGSYAIEFALVMPVLCGLMLGTIEFGSMLWAWNAIGYGVEQAARCRAVALTPGATGGCSSVAATQDFAAARAKTMRPLSPGDFSVYVLSDNDATGGQ